MKWFWLKMKETDHKSLLKEKLTEMLSVRLLYLIFCHCLLGSKKQERNFFKTDCLFKRFCQNLTSKYFALQEVVQRRGK